MFNPEADSIKAYLERVSLYFAANGVQDAKQVPILLSSIGGFTLLSLVTCLHQQHLVKSRLMILVLYYVTILNLNALLLLKVFIFTNKIKRLVRQSRSLMQP